MKWVAVLVFALSAACGGVESDGSVSFDAGFDDAGEMAGVDEERAGDLCQPVYDACTDALLEGEDDVICQVRYTQCYQCKRYPKYCNGCSYEPSDCE